MVSLQRVDNFIDGKFLPTERYLDSLNPSTEEVIAHIADGSAEDADRAVQAARQAFPSYVVDVTMRNRSKSCSFRWSRETAGKRAHYLNRIADLIQARLEDFARAESLDQGKPLWLARTAEIPRVIENFRFFAAALMQSRER